MRQEARRQRRFAGRPRQWWLRQLALALLLAAVATFALLGSISGEYDLAVGEVVPQDIRAPRELTYISQVLTQKARSEAERKVTPIYTSPDPAVARRQLERLQEVLAFLTAVRSDPYASDAQKRTWVLAVEELRDLPLNEVNTILALPDDAWDRVCRENRQLLNEIMRQETIRPQDVNEVRGRLPALVPLDLPQDEADLVAALTARFIAPNTFYDEAATDQARQQAAEAVGPVFRTVRAGEIIARGGDLLDEEELEALQELGLTGTRWDWGDAMAIALFAIAITILLGLYLHRLQPEILDNARQELLMTIVLIFFIVLQHLLIPSGPLLLYLYPAGALGMLLAATCGYATAIGGLLYIGLIGGWIGGPSLMAAVILTLNGITAALSLPRHEQTSSPFRSGLLGGMAGVVAELAFSAAEVRVDFLPTLTAIGASLTGGLISGGLTLGALFLLAPIFDLTTTFRLLELSNPNHPLLQRLLREAPGTFHHVIMVASMAEQAAERIGADALLTRTGAYYHDIGKLEHSYFFSENQQGNNPHLGLAPEVSAAIIKAHVRDGLALARAYHLPARVRAFIPEHHGTMRIYYFYHQALEAAEGDTQRVDEDLFRYEGPPPRSKETALVMLADAAEAATRAARPSTPEALAAIIDKIIRSRIDDHQLDECPLTMRELHIVRDTYIEVLRGLYHNRVRYPGEEKEKSDERKPSPQGELALGATAGGPSG